MERHFVSCVTVRGDHCAASASMFSVLTATLVGKRRTDWIITSLLKNLGLYKSFQEPVLSMEIREKTGFKKKKSLLTGNSQNLQVCPE